jgi:endonuclease/exonuclease/phosphatase family metal-dependent hydrolase
LTPRATALNTLMVHRQPMTSSSSMSTRRVVSFGIIDRNFLSLAVINLHLLVGIPVFCARFRAARRCATFTHRAPGWSGAE